MQNFTIDMRTDTAVFEDDPYCEIARILRNIADSIEVLNFDHGAMIFDANGNAIGTLTVTGDDSHAL